jgi:hypothetical protein
MGVVLLSCIILNGTTRVRAIFSSSPRQTHSRSAKPFAVETGSAAYSSFIPEPLDSLTTRVKVIIVQSNRDRPGLVWAVVRSQITFTYGMMMVRFRLVRYRFGL